MRAACVIGWPIKHSRSPLIHGYWIRQHGLDADYRREEVAPEAFADFIRSLSSRGYVGANITIPHKEAALELSEPDDCARPVGAANTLWLDGGRLRDRKSTRLNSSHQIISYAVFCLKKKKKSKAIDNRPTTDR